MTRLEVYIDAIAQVILNYHYAQTQQRCTKTIDELDAAVVTQLINETTIVYVKRRPLFEYLAHEFLILKEKVHHLMPFHPTDSNAIKIHLFDFLKNLQSLLKITESKSIDINYDGFSKSMKGLLRSGYTGYSICSSGNIIKKELFDNFNQNYLSEDSSLKKWLDALCDDYEEAIKEKEAQKTHIDELQMKIHQVTEENQRLLTNKNETVCEIETLKKQIVDANKHIETLSSKLDTFIQIQKQLDSQSRNQAKTILGLNSTNQMLQERLAKTSSPLPYSHLGKPYGMFSRTLHSTLSPSLPSQDSESAYFDQ